MSTDRPPMSLTTDEIARCVGRRPDGVAAAVVLDALADMPATEVRGVDVRNAEGVVVVDICSTVSGGDEDGPWTAIVPMTITIPLTPRTRRDLRYGLTMTFDGVGFDVPHTQRIVAAEGYVSPLHPSCGEEDQR